MRRLYDGKIIHGKRRSLTDLLWRRTPYRTSAGKTSTLVEEKVVRPAVSGSVLAGLASAVGVAIILKIVLLLAGVIPFNADEAVVALMARHITMGARPLFFYGQAYMGSLDAFLVALGFWVFGQHIWVIRLVQIILFAGTLVTTAFLGKTAFGSWKAGVIAAWLLAVPAVNTTLYTTVSLGGYGEMLLIGNLITITGLRIAKKNPSVSSSPPRGMLILLGFLVGLGLWAFGLTLVYALPACLFVFYRFWKKGRGDSQFFRALSWVILGGLIGALPWLLYAAQHGVENLLAELSGGAIAGVENLSWFSQVGQHLVNLLLLGSTALFGIRPPWEVRWLALPLIPLILFFWIWVIVLMRRSLRKGGPDRSVRVLLMGIGLTLIVGFVFTPFGADPSGRYFLPLAVILSLFAGGGLAQLSEKSPRTGILVLGCVLAFNLIGTFQTALKIPPGLTTQFDVVTQIDHRQDQALMAFLTTQGEQFGYTNYWVGYPLAFQSAESLIFIPRLPYHPDFRYTSRDDRYEPYTHLVNEADRVAYITTYHQPLNYYLRKEFTSNGITWREQTIGDYQVFYELSEPLRPEKIGLGITTP